MSESQIKMSPIFGRGMVVHRHSKILLWGSAPSGAKVIAELNGKTMSARTNQALKWEIELPSMNEGGPFNIINLTHIKFYSNEK